MLHLDPAFATTLQDYDLEAIDRSEQTVYAVDADCRLRFFNLGWDRFARANCGEHMLPLWPLGRSILEGIASDLLPFLQDAMAVARQKQTVFSHTYQCPTSTLDRTFTMMVYPLTQGWLFVHAECFAGPHQGPTHRYDPLLHRDQHGLTHQCAHCRKVRRAADTETWDWIPSLVEAPQATVSHGLCAACLGFYYPAA